MRLNLQCMIIITCAYLSGVESITKRRRRMWKMRNNESRLSSTRVVYTGMVVRNRLQIPREDEMRMITQNVCAQQGRQAALPFEQELHGKDIRHGGEFKHDGRKRNQSYGQADKDCRGNVRNSQGGDFQDGISCHGASSGTCDCACHGVFDGV